MTGPSVLLLVGCATVMVRPETKLVFINNKSSSIFGTTKHVPGTHAILFSYVFRSTAGRTEIDRIVGQNIKFCGKCT